MLANFGHPDASKAVQNLGITILSLLYGEKDFGKTQLIALNCGYDTDCTCATAGAIWALSEELLHYLKIGSSKQRYLCVCD